MITFGGIYHVQQFRNQAGPVTDKQEEFEMMGRYLQTKQDPSEETGFTVGAVPLNITFSPDGQGGYIADMSEMTHAVFVNDAAGNDFDWFKAQFAKEKKLFENPEQNLAQIEESRAELQAKVDDSIPTELVEDASGFRFNELA